MSSLSTESTPRERLARLVTLLFRTRIFWRSAAAIAAVGMTLALVIALRSKRAFRSETTVLYRDGLQQGEAEPAAQRAARLGPKLKDLLYARPTLEQVIRERDLFPDKTRRSMLDGIEEMTTQVGFRARAGDSFVISFTYEDAETAQQVAGRLAELMITEYNRHNLDTATLTRDFLRRKLEETSARADEESRKLSEFLAQHPQFQWGAADSPYAIGPGGQPLAPLVRPAPRAPAAPVGDPLLRAMERDLARIDAELYAGPAGPSAAPPAPGAAPQSLVEAQKQREAAAAALAAAQAALGERMLSVTAAHPDAVSARARVDAARQALAAADATLARLHAGTAAPGTGAPHEAPTPERRAGLERQRAGLRRQIADRRAALGPAAAASPEAPAAGVVELETEWHHLRLALDRARDELHTIQQNARAADIAADAVAKQGHEEMQILEPAYLPTRPDRGRGRVFFAGAAVALFLALGYAAARVLLDDRLLDEGDVEALGGPPVLVALPRLPEPAARPAERAIVPAVRVDDDPDADAPEPPSVPAVITPPPPDDPDGPAPLSLRGGRALAQGRSYPLVEAVFDDPEVEVIGADLGADGQSPARLPGGMTPEALSALRVLRHRLEQRRGDGAFVVSVMSPGPGEGKTTLAVRLALTLSEAERARVILVEGNFDRPRLAATLGLRLPPEAGFSAQLRERMGGRGVPWGVVRLGASLSLLAEPGLRAAHPQALHSTHFEAALGALRRSYEYVVIDGPPVVGSGDANVIEAVSDGVLVVVRAAATRGGALTRAMEQLGSARVLGVVLNDVEPARRAALREQERAA